MNSAFLRFRLRQAGKFIREIPVIYLVILTGILLIAGIALYQFTKDLHGSLIIAGILLVFLSLITAKRLSFYLSCREESLESIQYGLLLTVLAGPYHHISKFILVCIAGNYSRMHKSWFHKTAFSPDKKRNELP